MAAFAIHAAAAHQNMYISDRAAGHSDNEESFIHDDCTVRDVGEVGSCLPHEALLIENAPTSSSSSSAYGDAAAVAATTGEVELHDFGDHDCGHTVVGVPRSRTAFPEVGQPSAGGGYDCGDAADTIRKGGREEPDHLLAERLSSVDPLDLMPPAFRAELDAETGATLL